MTRKLYYEDSHLAQFTATVTSCTAAGKRWHVVLDRTAFFPEGGGQPGDTGTLGEAKVLDTREGMEDVVHVTDRPLAVGAEVEGRLDWGQRFGRMQNHSGEHIVSGLVHSRHGGTNVGFHMGDDGMLLDFDVELSAEQLAEIELLANEAVWADLPVRAEFPAPEVLAALDYRSKLDLTEDVRIVTIPGVDQCACCAPHVARTGEIGVIKVLDVTRHRGGVRVRVICGRDALLDYRMKHDGLGQVAVLFSAKPEKAAAAAVRVNDQLQDVKRTLGEVQRELIRVKLAAIGETEGNLVLFEPVLDGAGLRDLVTGAMDRVGGVCAAFSGSEKTGFQYVIGSRHVDLRAKAKEINAALEGRGGGAPEMIQGTAKCTRRTIRTYFGVE